MKISHIAAIVATSGILIGGIWTATQQRVDTEREAAIASASQVNSNLAIAYEESTTSNLNEVDLLLKLMAAEYRDEGVGTGKAVASWPVNAALIASLGVFDEDGALVFSTAPLPVENASSEEFFRVHLHPFSTAVHLGKPVRDPARDHWSFVMSRRLTKRDGTFAGVSVAQVDPAYFTTFFRRADLGVDGRVTFMGLDGIARVTQTGTTSEFGTDLRDSQVMSKQAQSSTGSFFGRGSGSGVKRFYSYRVSDEYPMVILVGTGQGEALAPVAQRASIYYLVAIFASLFIVLVAAGASRYLSRQRDHLESLARAQSELRQSEASFRAVIDSANEGIVIYDCELRVVGANHAAERILGLTLAEVSGAQGFTSLLPCVNEDGTPLAPEKRPTRITVATGEPVTGKIIGIERPASPMQWISVNTAVMRRAGDSTSFGLVSTIADITTQRRAEAGLRRNEALFRATFNQALIGIGHAGLDGRLMRVNPRMCEMLGYTEAELLQRSVLDFTHPDDKPESARAVKAMLSRSDLPSLSPVARRYVRKDGGLIWAMASVCLVRSADGAPDHFLGMMQDITELKRVEQTKNEFISTVSHELRTPLTSIRGSLGLLAGGVAGALPAAADKLIHIAAGNCERLIRLVNDILDVEKMHSGRMQLDLKVVDVFKMLENAVAANEGFARTYGVTLRMLPHAGPAMASVDPDRLHQAVTNFISNAVKYSPVERPVEVSLRRHGDRLRIAVRDYGPGIPLEFRTRIFQKFSQADGSDSRKKSGTGLGLCISKGIAENLGGSVGYDTVLGEGTTFFIEIPALDAQAIAPATLAIIEA